MNTRNKTLFQLCGFINIAFVFSNGPIIPKLSHSTKALFLKNKEMYTLQKAIVIPDHLRMKIFQKLLIKNGIHVLAKLIKNEPVSFCFLVTDVFDFVIRDKSSASSQKVGSQTRNEHNGKAIDKLKKRWSLLNFKKGLNLT